MKKLNFTFHNPTRIIFGEGKIATITQHIPSDARVLILYGQGSVLKNGVMDQVKHALDKAHIAFDSWGGIEPNPHYETCMQVVEKVRSEKWNYVLAVGGGSVIDACKFIAAAVPYTRAEPWEILETRGQYIEQCLTFACVLTLPATGSEMNNGAVITKASTQDKLFFGHALCFPQFSVLDPSMTYSLPIRQVSNGVVDAYVHVIEQYLTSSGDNAISPLHDRFSESILQTLIEEGPKVLVSLNDYATRANVMWCACMALNGLIGEGVSQDWATHMIGHELTALYGIDHAQSLAIVLPGVLQARKQAKLAKLIQYAQRVWHMPHESKESDEIMAQRAIEHTETFFQNMGVKTRLGDYGIGQEAIEKVGAALKKHGLTRLGERGEIDLAMVANILQSRL